MNPLKDKLIDIICEYTRDMESAKDAAEELLEEFRISFRKNGKDMEDENV